MKVETKKIGEHYKKKCKKNYRNNSETFHMDSLVNNKLLRITNCTKNGFCITMFTFNLLV